MDGITCLAAKISLLSIIFNYIDLSWSKIWIIIIFIQIFDHFFVIFLISLFAG